MLNVLIISVRKNFFFQMFSDNKKAILHGCIFRILEFTNVDYENMFYEPD